MAEISWLQIHGCPTSLRRLDFGAFLSPSIPKHRKDVRVVRIRATSSSEEDRSSGGKNPLSLVLDVPRAIWRQTLRPLGDFGFGRRSIWEGGVGLFLVSGVRYMHWDSREDQGVTVGTVVKVNPSLKSIDAVVEVDDEKTVIPRNSLVEVNQSGLLMETMIDVTPRDPIPTPTVGPLDPDCDKEGLIVCDRQRLKGQQGVSLDTLVGIFIRLGQEMEEIGVSRTYKLAEKVSIAIEEAKPLLAKIEAMAEDVRPLLTKVREGDLLKNVEILTRSLAEASEDLRLVHSSILTPENTELLRQSIATLIFTLKNIESITSDISSFTGDEATRRNLKLLIKSLSRLL